MNPDESAVESSWTREQMLGAIPADTPRPAAPAPVSTFDLPAPGEASVSARRGDFLVRNPTSFPKRLHGRVFFRVGRLAYACSGTVVSTRYGNAIYTASHCLYDRKAKRFVSDLAFVPSYQNGTFPLGIYTATHLLATKRWIKHGSLAFDVGMATLTGSAFGSLAKSIGGARPVAFNLNPKKRKYTIFGYPADPKPVFNGQFMFGCRSHFAGRDRGRPRTLSATPCHMGHGASGGGWITKGYLNSVNSYIYCETTPRACGYIFGPYFGKAARNLYTSKVIGGSVPPVVAVLKGPRKVRKRKVHFVILGLASTPLRIKCKLDRHRWRKCRRHTVFRHLRRGRHVLRVKARDQIGRKSRNVAKRKFRVLRRR